MESAQEMKGKAKDAKTPQELPEPAKAMSGELSDEELENVAGGMRVQSTGKHI